MIYRSMVYYIHYILYIRKKPCFQISICHQIEYIAFINYKYALFR